MKANRYADLFGAHDVGCWAWPVPKCLKIEQGLPYRVLDKGSSIRFRFHMKVKVSR